MGRVSRSGLVKVGATVVVLGAALSLLAWSLSRRTERYVKVDELLARAHGLRGKTVWLGGRVKKGSHLWKPGSPPTHRFVVEWGGKEVWVVYLGHLPAGFRDGVPVTLRGRLTDEGLFRASEVTTKCPSKYRAREAGR